MHSDRDPADGSRWLPSSATPAALAALPDDALLEQIQRQSFGFFWDGAEPSSGLARDRCTRRAAPATDDDLVASGGSGFAVMSLIVAVERGWISRAQGLQRLEQMLDALWRAPSYHGVWAHFFHARSGATIAFGRKDDGGDLVETSFLCMGLLCAREYFNRQEAAEERLRGRITYFWEEVEWNWYTQGGRSVLYWHWSPNNGWALNHPIQGWNECLITYVLAAGAPRYPIEPMVYHRGFANGRDFLNGRSYHGIELPLGPSGGGPLFFTHYSFLGLDPRGLEDRYADYWQQNVRQVHINRAHCVANAQQYRGYGPDCWGLTASDEPGGYSAHAPDNDNGTIAPTAALASMPYAPQQCLAAARHFLSRLGERIWGPYGFVDAFCEQRDWYADTYLAIDQGPIIVMIENHRTGLLWNLFMRVHEVRSGLARLGFRSPHLSGAAGR